MEILEQREAFVHQDGDLVFNHTKIILKRIDEYFYARTDERLSRVSTVDLECIELHDIPASHIWPDFDPTFTQAPDPLPPNCFVKQPSLLQDGDTPASMDTAGQLLTEIEACEILRHHPHPNTIAQYLGCIVKDSRIRGLCFVKYSTTLTQALQDKTPLDRDFFLSIQRGVEHLHDLGLIHNDLKPCNIMMDGNKPVIIDFDTCKREGESLGSKAGTVGWTKPSSLARRENDIYSMSLLQAALDRP